MSELLQAADTIERELNRLKGLQVAAQAIRRIGSFEQAEEDAKRRHAEITGKVNEAAADLAAVKKNIEQTKDAGNKIVADARSEADKILTEVAATAEDLLVAAESRAKSILTDASANARKTIDAAMARKSDIDTIANLREGQAQAAQAAVDSAKRELAEVTVKIEKAKDEIKRLLG